MWFIAVVFAIVAAVALLLHYADRSIKFYILALVAFSWCCFLSTSHRQRTTIPQTYLV